MSDDLINRKTLRDELCKYRQQFSIGSCENITVSAAIGFVNTAPTAFDKEKVIEELTLHKKFADYKTQAFDEAGDVQNMEIQDFVSLALQGAIRIVEKGGLN